MRQLTILAALALVGFGCKEGAPPPSGPQTTTVTLAATDGGMTVGDARAPVPASSGAPSATASGAPASGAPASGAAGADAAPSDFYACAATPDCVAVPKVGCCNNGYKEAVNK